MRRIRRARLPAADAEIRDAERPAATPPPENKGPVTRGFGEAGVIGVDRADYLKRALFGNGRPQWGEQANRAVVGRA